MQYLTNVSIYFTKDANDGQEELVIGSKIKVKVCWSADILVVCLLYCCYRYM